MKDKVMVKRFLPRIPAPDCAESYLSLVEKDLAPICEPTRDELLQELSQHLDARIAANVEVGTPHEFAVVQALQQMGAPEITAKSLLKEWRRSRSQRVSVAHAKELSWIMTGVIWLAASSAVTTSWSVAVLLVASGLLLGIPLGRFAGHKMLNILSCTTLVVSEAPIIAAAVLRFTHPDNARFWDGHGLTLLQLGMSIGAVLYTSLMVAVVTGYQHRYGSGNVLHSVKSVIALRQECQSHSATIH